MTCGCRSAGGTLRNKRKMDATDGTVARWPLPAEKCHDPVVWKRIKPFAIAGAIIVVSLLGYRTLPYHIRAKTLLDGPWNELKFDGEAWRLKEEYNMGAGEISSLKRGMMLEDLCNNHLRKGMHKEEVRRLLGTPDNQGNEGPGLGHSLLPANQWTYCLGSWSGFRMDGDFLTIVFDDEDRLDFFNSWQG